MVNCCVPFCTSYSGKPVSFHQFPSKSDSREAWLKAISRLDFVVNDISASSVVCSLHFKPEDYVVGIKLKKLKPGAVPSIFSGYPSYKVPKVNKPRCQVNRTASVDKIKRKNEAMEEINRKKLKSSKIDELNEVSEPIKEDISHTTNFELENECLDGLKYSNRLLKSNLWKKNKKIQQLISEVNELQRKLDYFEKDPHHVSLEKMLCMEDHDDSASFILQQVENFFKKKPTWSENSIRECVLWHSISPKSYQSIRDRRSLILPCKRTLSNYTGPLTGELGVTSLIKERLKEERVKLNPYETFVSLVIDEMSIQQKSIYDKSLDCIFGEKTELVDGELKGGAKLAKHLLCFIIRGLSTNFAIPCGYFFSVQLTAMELYNFTLHVLKEIEECGFLVIRMVTDNLKVNRGMFCLLGNNSLKTVVDHPFNKERKIFLGFDSNHIIKNVRSLFLERDMTDGQGIISGMYVKNLYNLQKNEVIKPVRSLTYKHVQPTNIEKMNVARAVLIFSPPVTASLEFLKDQAVRFGTEFNFKDASATILFLKNFYKWFSIHDVASRHKSSLTRNPDQMHFFTISDDRLKWLQEEFLDYLSGLKSACESHVPKLKCLSRETYEAVVFTTNSTVQCIQYLLQNGYHYVLTRAFNSDPVESFFSALRQMNGGNDLMDVRAAICSLEKILKTGIVIHKKNSNIGSSNYNLLSKSTLIIAKEKAKSKEINDIPQFVVDRLNQLDSCDVTERISVSFASVAFVAGFVARILEQETNCSDCLAKISSAKCDAPIFKLICNQDRGGLFYPSRELIKILYIIQCFIDRAMFYMASHNVVHSLTQYILPKLIKSPLLSCQIEEHRISISKTICSRYLPILLKNIVKTNNDKIRPHIFNKPLSRKVLKL